MPDEEPEAVAAALVTPEKELNPPPDNAASILAAIVAALNGPEASNYEDEPVASIRKILRGAGVEV